MRRLVIATRNKGKLREFVELFADLPFEIVSLAEYPDVAEVPETGATFTENAIIKASAAAQATGELSLADDSGLEIDALGGEPGVRSARFAPTTEERNAKVLNLMKDVPDEKRTAHFRCVIAVAVPGDASVQTAEGAVEGRIAHDLRGTQGFGYDPIFEVTEAGTRMAELDSDQKNRISHRARASAGARVFLKQLL